METYTFFRGQFRTGIEIVEQTKMGPAVVLGDQDQGPNCKIVPLAYTDPVEVIDGWVYDAEIFSAIVDRGKETEHSRLVLKKPLHRSDDVLVRIRTEAVKSPKLTGNRWVLAGSPNVIAKGFDEFDLTPRGRGGWRDGLTIMRPGDVIRVNPEPKPDFSFVIMCEKDGMVRCLPYERYKTLCEAVQALTLFEI